MTTPNDKDRIAAIHQESIELVERLAGKIICYHGTTPENAESILKEGFRAGSYFAYRVEDSLAYGGPYLFAVAFSADPAMWHGEENGFQFHLREAMGPEEILWHTPIVLTLLAAERERCAEIACGYCRNGNKPYCHSQAEERQGWFHKLTPGGDEMPPIEVACKANAIRALPSGPDALKEHDERVKAEAVLGFLRERYPITGGPNVAWSVMLPFDDQCKRNHSGQDLKEIAQRGGLSALEAICIVNNWSWYVEGRKEWKTGLAAEQAWRQFADHHNEKEQRRLLLTEARALLQKKEGERG